MPQMSPLYWLILFILFSLILMFMMIKLYFLSYKKISINKNENAMMNPQKLNWKW